MPQSFIEILWINNTAWSLTFLFSTEILIGINVALTLFQKARMVAMRGGLTSGIGMVLGLLEAGCASCGSVLLSSVLGIGVATSLLTLLPAQGKEFGVIAFIISSISVYITCRKIANPPVCSLKRK